MTGLKGIYIVLSMTIVIALALPATIASAQPAPSELKNITFIDNANKGTSANPAPPLNNLSYKLLGLKLNSTFTYYVNPRGSGNSQSATANQTQLSFAAWNATTNMVLFNYGGSTDKGYGHDGRNTVLWAPLSSTVVSKTVIWYVPDTDNDGFGQIVESDIILNKNLKWGIDPDVEGPITIDSYDIRNVITHDAGHIVGLADMCDGAYCQLTMHGNYSKGETIKISLEGGDVTGAQYLYGARTTR